MASTAIHSAGPEHAQTKTTVINKLRPRVEPIPKPQKSPEQLMRRYQELVDGKALVIFPLSFLLFNVCYWTHYLVDLNWI